MFEEQRSETVNKLVLEKVVKASEQSVLWGNRAGPEVLSVVGNVDSGELGFILWPKPSLHLESHRFQNDSQNVPRDFH